MVVCPCSGSTLAAIAQGMGTNLIHRAAEVHLKERRKLILVPRETPLSLPQIDNMRRATEAGAVVLPASPGFYHGVEAVADLVNFVVARICDQLGVGNELISRWGAGKTEKPGGS
jgi:4-hydroxy-3-polyprenylbenzoate decarboxylase